MKLLSMHKVNADMEAGGKPSKEIIDGMGKLVGGMISSGKFFDGAGLKPSATRARVTVSGGQRHVEKGPYAGRNELIAGTCMLRADTLEKAIDWAGQLAQALGDGAEVEVGPITQPWDLGAPMPSPLPVPQFLALAKGDAKSEAGTPFLSRVAAPLEAMKHADAFISANGLLPSREGKRVQQRRDRRHVLDGPFTESKELIAGYCAMNLASWDEALAFGDTFAKVLGGDIEMDMLVIAD